MQEDNAIIFLSENFTLAEMLESPTARRMKLKAQFNPPHHVVERLKLLCKHVLQPLRDHVGPIHVSSGYRCPELNVAVRGAKNSQHLTGEASDIQGSGNISNKMLFDAIISLDLPFDQIIWEYGTSKEPAWVHVSYGPRDRRQILYVPKSLAPL